VLDCFITAAIICAFQPVCTFDRMDISTRSTLNSPGGIYTPSAIRFDGDNLNGVVNGAMNSLIMGYCV